MKQLLDTNQRKNKPNNLKMPRILSRTSIQWGRSNTSISSNTSTISRQESSRASYGETQPLYFMTPNSGRISPQTITPSSSSAKLVSNIDSRIVVGAVNSCREEADSWGHFIDVTEAYEEISRRSRYLSSPKSQRIPSMRMSSC
mmetsp:Transcript_20768/g.30585  ORF Transcript_20768/g.30585 Transcript_20768/m.30585 type:complete len:144 (+) Transcript_20768:116-547(+)